MLPHARFREIVAEYPEMQPVVQTLVRLQEHYGEWLEKLPESLHGTALGAQLEALTELDLDALQAVEPPLGCGRD